MGKVKTSRASGTLGPVQIFSALSSAAEVSLTLQTPCRYFSVLMQKGIGSTSATLAVTGHLAASSLSTAGVTLISFAGTTSTGGTMTSTESTGPIGRLSFNHAAGASSGGLSVWVTASP